MTRPQAVRADTMDLQDTNAPSAKDHSRRPTSPGALGEGPPAPHQANALKSAGLEGIELRTRSPRASQDLSGKEIQLLQNHDENEEASNSNLEDIGVDSQDIDIDEEDEEMEDDMMDKISSSPSIDDEDIDFELVYALHTFVATVEGQANATKGDTMVLLDDSNSYWWLVRIVKDSSIGYLPAEHIETPTERLARLNKHRNIDLSQTMLGDNPEKARSNPLRKARKRRNARTVQFAEPTFYEPSEHDYSSDEDVSPDDVEFITTAEVTEANEDMARNADIVNEATKEPEAPEETNHAENNTAEVAASVAAPAAAIAAVEAVKPTESSLRDSVDSIDDGLAGKKTRIRNTDSFYKDDSIETKRINLTPSLLREGNANAAETQQSNRARSSSESTTKSNSSDKPVEKRKEKKSVLGRLFKVKNSKKAQVEEEAEEWIAKDLGDKPGSRSSADTSGIDVTGSPTSSIKGQPTRTGSKLQKSPPPQKSNSFNRGNGKGPASITIIDPVAAAPQLEPAPAISPIINPFADGADPMAKDVQLVPETSLSDNLTTSNEVEHSPTASKIRNLFSSNRGALDKTEPTAQSRPEKVKNAPSREPIEVSSDSDTEINVPRDTSDSKQSIVGHRTEAPAHTISTTDISHVHSEANDTSRSVPQSTGTGTSSSTPELIERPSQEIGASNASTIESSAESSKKEIFNWSRCKKWFDEDFNDWYTCLMDVSDEMKNFNWKNHWAYKQYCQDIVEQHEKVVDELDWSLVDYYDIEKRAQKQLPPFHPSYRQIGWEQQWMQHEQDSIKKGEDPGWLPWKDPEFAYLYPHRPAPQGAAAGPPAGSICRPQHQLKIIGPAALTMQLPPLHNTDSKSPFPHSKIPALVQESRTR